MFKPKALRFFAESGMKEAMTHGKLNLLHFTSFREGELLDRVRDTEFENILQRKLTFAETPIAQFVFREAYRAQSCEAAWKADTLGH